MLVLENRYIGKVRAGHGDSVFLMPGQLYVGRGVASVRTLLGSCVAITLWHPVTRHAAMCHFLLPDRARPRDGARDGRYGDEALEQIVEAIRHVGADPGEYHAQVYGGADTLPYRQPIGTSNAVRQKVGERNVEKAWMLVEQYAFRLDSVDVGGNEPRLVLLDAGTGLVELRRAGEQRRDAGRTAPAAKARSIAGVTS
ncbi:MAG: chemotaxis protein CheD [Lautropia sp.]